MFVSIKEVGTRPALLTKARMNAPQGAKAIADTIYDSNICDRAILMIDWDGDSLWDTASKGPMPEEMKRPLFIIYADKYYSNVNRYASIEIPLDMEEVFGQDNFTREIAMELAQHIKEEFERKHYESYSMKEFH